ncbi:MAG TPA: sulfite oxidase, partial [Longimicrobiales bacterium]|nr:sulfite oxidase [Longimicrobiales bacterium]
LEELRDRPTRTIEATLECAGNGRRLMSPTPGGTPWALGAVSTASFTGTPLAGLLEEAGLRDEAVEVVTAGADAGELPGGERGPYARSLPLDVARDPDVLVAWAMDGEPLRTEHGAPLRLVVPGWYAMASVKWLVRVEAVTEPFVGPYQALRYVYVGERGTPHRLPVTRMRVRSLVARPADGEVLGLGEQVRVAGSAWSGGRRVVRVEVSTDGGRSWRDADLGEPPGPHAAVPWRLDWTPGEEGRHELVARATDDAGDRQPLAQRWNRYGYGNNVVHRVGVTVRG